MHLFLPAKKSLFKRITVGKTSGASALQYQSKPIKQPLLRSVDDSCAGPALTMFEKMRAFMDDADASNNRKDASKTAKPGVRRSVHIFHVHLIQAHTIRTPTSISICIHLHPFFTVCLVPCIAICKPGPSIGSKNSACGDPLFNVTSFSC